MAAKPWFSTYVYESPLRRNGSHDLTRALLEDCHKIRDQDQTGQAWCKEGYPSGYTSYETLRRLHQTVPTFVDLERKIWPHVKRFARRIDMDLRDAQLSMVDCWVNIMSSEAAHPLHVHPGAVVSGTFYVKTPDGCSGIRFEDPRLDKFVGVPPRRPDCRPENSQQISYDVQAGKLILFESWLRHGVAPNPTREERVSVSFNYAWV